MKNKYTSKEADNIVQCISEKSKIPIKEYLIGLIYDKKLPDIGILELDEMSKILSQKCIPVGYNYLTHIKTSKNDEYVADLEKDNKNLKIALLPFCFYDENDAGATTEIQESWELRYNDIFKEWVDYEDICRAREVYENIS